MITDSAYCIACDKGYPYICNDDIHEEEGIIFSKFAKTRDRKPPFLFVGFKHGKPYTIEEED
jgi:hypothetical protein